LSLTATPRAAHSLINNVVELKMPVKHLADDPG
jgi:hypothetical protein